MPRRRIDLGDETDRYRYRCPRGHVQYEPRAEGWYCVACADADWLDADPAFECLYDCRTGEYLPREAVSIEARDAFRHPSVREREED